MFYFNIYAWTSVPSFQVRTNTYRLRLINLKTFRIDNCNFTTQFYLNTLSICKLHAFVLYFRIGFTKGHKDVFLSTAPQEKPTRWKQMIFYFKDGVSCQKSNIVAGDFVLRYTDEQKLAFRIGIRFVRSWADEDRIRQQYEAKQRPYMKIINHPSGRRKSKK